jgi:Family of unknown function (DUF6687)
VLPLGFVPYHELGDQPNVVVDGAAAPSTVLTLSHWPGSPTPPELLDDLSAQIVFHALAQPERFAGVDIVTNNHFDQDGLVSAFTLVDPDGALARRGPLVDLARAGDFGTFESRDAIRLAFAIAAFEDPVRSPLDADVLAGSYEQQCGRLHEVLLPRVAELVDHPESVRLLWEDEDARLSESLDAIERGVIRIEEQPAVDLAIVTVPPAWGDRAATRFTMTRTEAVHPSAVNQSTSCLRVLVEHGGSYRLELRYETWVMFRSRVVLPRPDLRLLAARLDEREPGPAHWTADGPGALTPHLQVDASELPPEVVRAEVESFLASAPAAWDPYRVSR